MSGPRGPIDFSRHERSQAECFSWSWICLSRYRYRHRGRNRYRGSQSQSLSKVAFTIGWLISNVRHGDDHDQAHSHSNANSFRNNTKHPPAATRSRCPCPPIGFATARLQHPNSAGKQLANFAIENLCGRQRNGESVVRITPNSTPIAIPTANPIPSRNPLILRPLRSRAFSLLSSLLKSNAPSVLRTFGRTASQSLAKIWNRPSPHLWSRNFAMVVSVVPP